MTNAGEFRRRAFHEAHRYGGDAWVFVRELLQNSRDAGAGRVDLLVERRDGVDRIHCRDDGCGMTFDHARRYLFTLYASSKSGQSDTAGRFGIGFWAVLRFEPDEVTVRSAPEQGPGWQLRMSGDLEEIERGGSSLGGGTEIELTRTARGDDPVAAVWDAVQRDARHLRGEDGEILEVWVNSRRATAEIELEPPSLGFAGSGLRGAVALTDRPRVDLLAHGLRVRTTATLDELLTQPDRRRRRSSSTPEGLVPRVILDSRRLQVLMARGDARTDRELRKLVAIGRRGVRRLVRGQLDQGSGLGWFRRAGMRCLELLPARWARKLAVGLVVVAILAAGAWWLAGKGPARKIGLGARGTGALAQSVRRPDAVLEAEAADRYRGPAADLLEALPAEIPLRYLPSHTEPLLSVFRIIALADDGRIVPAAPSSGPRPYLGATCNASCLEIALDLDGMSGGVRLPVPTGQLLDPASLRLEGGEGVLWAAPDGGPLLVIEGILSGSVRYRTGPGFESQPIVEGSWPILPKTADDFALHLRPLETDEAARVARDWVRRQVVYDTSERTVDRHRAAAREEPSFAQRSLMVGAGDCDVQNALVAAILARAGVPVRMAVGFVGAHGRAMPGLHAWVEYRGEGGGWRAVDASRGAPTSPLPPRPSVDAGAPPGVAEEEMSIRTRALPRSWTGISGRTLGGVAVAFALAAVGSVWVVRRRWAVHIVQPEGAPDLAGLLQGALARPEAYREMPSLFARRVVPVLDESAISLDRARSLSQRGRLAVSFCSSKLALRAAKTGLPVIDGSRPEGETVAATLGAIDLDRWDGIVRRSEAHRVTEDLERAAAGVGEIWKVVIGSGLADEVVVLDGRLAGHHPVVVVDRGSALWDRVCRLTANHPARALLLLADQVIERLEASPSRKRRLLVKLATETVMERAQESS